MDEHTSAMEAVGMLLLQQTGNSALRRLSWREWPNCYKSSDMWHIARYRHHSRGESHKGCMTEVGLPRFPAFLLWAKGEIRSKVSAEKGKFNVFVNFVYLGILFEGWEGPAPPILLI